MLVSHRWFLVVALLASSATEALADTVRVAGQDLELPAPMGYCFLDRENPLDAFVMDAVEQPQRDRNKVLFHFAPCDELDAWHNGTGNTTRYGNISATKIEGLVRPIPLSRSEYLDGAAAELPNVDVAAVEAEMNAKSEDIKVADTSLVGVLARDSKALYAGMLGRAIVDEDSDRQSKEQATVVALTLLRSIPFAISLSTPAAPEAFNRLLAEMKPYLSELVRLNP